MSIQHGNLGVIKKDLQIYYNREWVKSFRGESATNYAGAIASNCESASAYWSSTITKDTSTGYTAFKVIPLSGGYQSAPGVWRSCGIIAGTGGFQPPGTYSLSAKVLLPKDSIFTIGFRAYPYGEEFPVDVTGTGLWQTVKRENFTCTGYNYIQLQMVRRVNGVTSDTSANFPGDPFWIRDIMINSGSYAKTFSLMTNELSARPENTTNITNNANFASAISGTDSGGTQNGWTFGSWSGSGNAYATQASTTIYSSGTTSYSAIPLRLTRTSAGSMDFFSSSWNTLTNGVVYTLSFWARSNTTGNLDVKHQNLGTIKTYSIDSSTGWYKYSATFTHAGGTQYPYFTHSASNGTWIEIANVQLEAKSYPTDFTTSNRTSIANTSSNGGGLLDLSGNNVNADLTSVSFDTTGYIFTGASSNKIQFTTPTSFIYSAAGKTILMWIKYNSTTYVGFCGLGNASAGQSFNLRSNSATTQYLGFMGYSADYDPGVGPQINNNVWHLIGATFDAYGAGNLKLYVDGVNIASTTNTLNTAPEASNIGYIGRSSHTGAEGYLTGQVGQFMMYNRALSAAEILQIFTSQRKTYGV